MLYFFAPHAEMCLGVGQRLLSHLREAEKKTNPDLCHFGTCVYEQFSRRPLFLSCDILNLN